MAHYYALDSDLSPRSCHTLDEYGRWHESMPASSDWYQRKTPIGFQLSRDEVVPGVEVSTVFLAINHDFLGEGEPILWETMVFAKDRDDVYQKRYTSHAEAVERHKQICRLIASEGIEALTNGSPA